MYLDSLDDTSNNGVMVVMVAINRSFVFIMHYVLHYTESTMQLQHMHFLNEHRESHAIFVVLTVVNIHQFLQFLYDFRATRKSYETPSEKKSIYDLNNTKYVQTMLWTLSSLMNKQRRSGKLTLFVLSLIHRQDEHSVASCV